MNMELKEKQVKYIYDYLIDVQRLDLIDLMARSDRQEIHVLKINKKLVPSTAHHNTIINYLKKNGVDIVYPKGKVV